MTQSEIATRARASDRGLPQAATLPTSQRARRALDVLAVIGLVGPVIAYFAIIARYGVNVPVGDQWEDVNLIGRALSGHLTWSLLWAQHNENRIFFPNLIVLGLGYVTKFNVVVEQYLAAVMMVASVGLFIVMHRRRSPGRHLIYYCPVAILSLSLVQSGNMLWGFQMAWYLVMLCLALVLFLLDSERLTWPVLVAAMAVAVVGSYSSLQGLFIWIAALGLLWQRQRPRPMLVAWFVAASLTAALYYYNFNYSLATPLQDSAIHHRIRAIKFFFMVIGNVVGRYPTDNYELVFGVAIVAAALWVLVRYGARRDLKTGGPVAVALIVFGILFALSITWGRSWAGVLGSGARRYTTYDLLILVGIYMALIDRPPTGVDRSAVRRERESTPPPDGWIARWDRIAVPATRVFLVVAICLQFGWGLANGLWDAQYEYRNRVVAVDVLANIKKASPLQVYLDLNFFGNIPKTRQEADVARRYHLSTFDTPLIAQYRKRGLFCRQATLNPGLVSCP